MNPRLGATTILIADDDDDQFQLMVRRFGRVEPECVLHRAHDGLEVLDFLAAAMERKRGEKTPVAVLLDLRMPGLDGWEALERIRALPEYADVPVVVVSSDASKEVVDRARRCGADACIAKPIDGAGFNVLVTTINRGR